MLRHWRTRKRIRPWIAVVASYAVALQLLLTGLTAAHLQSADYLFAEGTVPTCLGEHGGGTGKLPAHDPSCVLCTLAQKWCGIPDDQNVSAIDVISLAVVSSTDEDLIVRRRSPTGHYQRGPPARTMAVG